MIQLKIEKIDGYHYEVREERGTRYQLTIEFYDLKEEPNVQDEIYLHEALLREKNTMLSFGPIEGKYGREITSPNDIDLLILVKQGEKIYLKRYYG